MMIEEFLSHFQSVKQNGNQYMALCPAHDDRKASLSIRLSEDGNKNFDTLFCRVCHRGYFGKGGFKHE